MSTGTSVSDVFPLGSRLNERGRLEVGGCDTIELAREFGTPAYVVAEDDLRSRARTFVRAGRDCGHEDFHVVFASKAFPCTAVLRVFAEEGLWCDVASGGELHLALQAGFRPERLVLHGNAKSETELGMALGIGVGLIVVDNLEEIDRLEELLAERDGAVQRVLVRVTPDVRGDTHEKISTGQADSKFGFSAADLREAMARVQAIDGLVLEGVHAHIGSQLLELEPFVKRGRRGRRGCGRRRFPGMEPGRRPGGPLHRGSARAAGDRAVCRRDREGRARPRHGRRQAPSDRAGKVAVRERGRDAVHGGERQGATSRAGSRSTAGCPTTCGR